MSKPSESIVRVMSAEEIVARGGDEPTRLLWPQRTTCFAERAMRLKQLSRGHAAEPYLAFMAEVAQGQQAVLADFPEVPLPDDADVAHALQQGLTPLPATDWPRDPAWRQGLRALVAHLRDRAPAHVVPVLDGLEAASDDTLEHQADLLLSGVTVGLDLAAAPLVGAALQVYWTHMVTASEAVRSPTHYAGLAFDAERTCPCCGSHPTASVTRAVGAAAGQRYLSCSLCGTQWNMVRIQCAHCLGSQHIAYLSLDLHDSPDDGASSRAGKAAVLAETCDDCGVYLKIMHVDRDPFIDPVADDLATLALDVLVSDTGKTRHGVNLMLLFSAADASAEPLSPD